MILNDWFSTNLKDRKKGLYDFKITINPYEFSSKGFIQNCTDAANEIANKYENIHVCYSGGLDSEFVLNTFANIGLNPKAVIVKTSYNLEEFSYALSYCKRMNISYDILEYSNKDFLIKLHEKTHKRNLHAMLGGVPLLVNDYVKSKNGHLITGYGDPFDISEGTLHQMAHNPTATISNMLEFSEWDYYLESYDEDNPNAFFTYNLPVFYSLINEINYNIPFQKAKSDLYQLEYRQKMFFDIDFEVIAAKMNDLHRPNVVHCSVDKDELINYFNTFKL